MWCRDCEQNVESVRQASSSGSCCARCGTPVSDSIEPTDTGAGPIPDPVDEAPKVGWDEWDFDESLMQDQPEEGEFLAANEATDLPLNVFHEAHDSPTPYYAAHRGRGRKRPDARRKHASPMTWALLSFGIATLMCGGVLMGWSFLGARTELWTVGTPLALMGQAMILIGLVLQMDIIWQSSRDTSITLEEIDDQISDLRQTKWQQPYHGETGTKYFHPAQEPSPQMLIADLKGQLEKLSVRVAQRDRDAE